MKPHFIKNQLHHITNAHAHTLLYHSAATNTNKPANASVNVVLPFFPPRGLLVRVNTSSCTRLVTTRNDLLTTTN